MKKLSLILFLGIIICGISAGGVCKKDLGCVRQSADETKVWTKQPLILPPEYNVRPKVIETDENFEDEE